jgi:dephospho-CoA kinase
LTGGIGSGKSTVANMFATLGVRIIDTDVISRQLTQTGGEAIPAIRAAFGPHALNDQNALDRSKMRELVFGDPGARKRRESILHPLILTHVRRQAAEFTDAPYTLIVVPLLFESGSYANWLQRVIAVDCPEEAQIARTAQRSGLDESTVRAIMAQQLARCERCRLADEVLHNDGGLDDLNKQVVGMHRHLSVLAAESD